MREMARAGLLTLAIVTACACRPVPDEAAPAKSARRASPAIRFSYGTTQGGELGHAQTYGRATALLFGTTFDLASQVQASRLNELVHRFRPRVNVGAVMLEPPKYALLADAFRTSLQLDYPIALADDETRRGEGPFGRLDRVPTVVVLDAAGREVWRKSGVVPVPELEQALRRAQRGP
ncbi:MAG TPA: TlpA family protein disulfide reductase [Polyangiaceae bacterium]